MSKKSYIIVDEYNNWLSTGYDATEEEINSDIEEIRNRQKEDGRKNAKMFLFEITGKPIFLIS